MDAEPLSTEFPKAATSICSAFAHTHREVESQADRGPGDSGRHGDNSSRAGELTKTQVWKQASENTKDKEKSHQGKGSKTKSNRMKPSKN